MPSKILAVFSKASIFGSKLEMGKWDGTGAGNFGNVTENGRMGGASDGRLMRAGLCFVQKSWFLPQLRDH